MCGSYKVNSHNLRTKKKDYTDADPIYWLNVEIPQFRSNQADIQATLLTQKLDILTKFHDDLAKKNIDFLLLSNFWTSLFFSKSVSIFPPYVHVLTFIQNAVTLVSPIVKG